jgi:hypothetical protein
MSKEISIKIIKDKNGIEQQIFETSGLKHTEILGLLRLYEQKITLDLLREFDNKKNN